MKSRKQGKWLVSRCKLWVLGAILMPLRAVGKLFWRAKYLSERLLREKTTYDPELRVALGCAGRLPDGAPDEVACL